MHLPEVSMGMIPLFRKNSLRIIRKRAIGKFAKTIINEGETIILDSGTTTLEISKILLRIKAFLPISRHN